MKTLVGAPQPPEPEPIPWWFTATASNCTWTLDGEQVVATNTANTTTLRYTP